MQVRNSPCIWSGFLLTTTAFTLVVFSRPMAALSPSRLAPLPLYSGRGELLIVFMITGDIMVVVRASALTFTATMNVIVIERDKQRLFIVSRTRDHKFPSPAVKRERGSGEGDGGQKGGETYVYRRSLSRKPPHLESSPRG